MMLGKLRLLDLRENITFLSSMEITTAMSGSHGPVVWNMNQSVVIAALCALICV